MRFATTSGTLKRSGSVISAINVFLSSTFADFVSEREQLLNVLPYIDAHVVCAERSGDQGTDLLTTLKALIDKSQIIVLLIGSRAGTKSESGERWTKEEIDYAYSRGKRIFAYVRELPDAFTSFVDQDRTGKEAVDSLVETIKKHVALIPRFKLGECCKLTAMVIRDVHKVAFANQLRDDQRGYEDSF